ncbi:MAG: DNA mismatch repair endonuclease MutL [Calditrichaeota bacterium]|nr:MAG: DNA mismatch repair endonuclease MutL [Calditrichota bacterium]
MSLEGDGYILKSKYYREVSGYSMPKINVLPPNIANKIAAGEVVDRPASVVKELVENSIDAGATEITVVIQQAGKELIQVVDNGSGMDETDAVLAFERHATSKITNIKDLDRIFTLGFRGEALPSIASVSRLELITCTADSNEGVLLRINGGKLEHKEKVAAQPGTIISVKNLFFNTPARRNFLRADTTEFNHILKWLKRFFLAYPNIHFTLINNGEELYHLPATSLDERIAQVFGKEFYEGLVFVQEDLGEISLQGYVCRPDMARGNTQNQFIFLNRRTIVNRNLSHAVFQGYGNLLERSRYPQFVMFLEIPPHLVDVNVHPTKMEVRFANERVIYHLFLSAVRKAIQSKNIIPKFSMAPQEKEKQEIQKQFISSTTVLPSRETQSGKQSSQISPASSQQQMSFEYEELPTPSHRTAPSEEEAPTTQQSTFWQVHNRYILSQIPSGLVIIDQHVAHERILFEQISDSLKEGKSIPTQQLLFPQTIELSLDDYLIYQDIKEWLSKIGFAITELSGRSIVIEGIPGDVKVGKEEKILLEILDYFRENEGNEYPPHERIAAAFACKNAIKSGEKLTQEEMKSLVNQLFQTREPYFCPHGRPVIVTLHLEELDKKFKRI